MCKGIIGGNCQAQKRAGKLIPALIFCDNREFIFVIVRELFRSDP